ncbi:hypothetical protein BJX63DRAFT_432573 [Aspergillus granulosus]|uniref:Alcohol acetyltransferase FCK4 n=1 Tax=Aspergillus granulosus TaxID=176169 RepID=A0ABR4HAZ5_9EURO
MSPSEDKVLRAASKNDRRYITRHSLGFYRALIVAGLYTFSPDLGPGPDSSTDSTIDIDITDINTYIPALKHSLAAHPILSTGIRGQDGEEPVFVRPGTVDLRRHIEMRDPVPATHSTGVEEIVVLQRAMLQAHDRVFEDVERVPPWKVIVLPLPRKAGCQRAYVLFAYSHSHGDGKSGLNFHRTFLEGLRRGGRGFDCTPVYPTADLQNLPPALEDVLAEEMGRISHTDRIGEDVDGAVMQYNAGHFRTGSELLLVPRERVEGVVRVCREKGGARLTGLLNQLVVRALSEGLPASDASCAAEDFIGTIVVDLRALVPAYTRDGMVNCVSALYERSLRGGADGAPVGLREDEALWALVRGTTARLAHSATTVVDQPIGLVQYLDRFRPWFLEKIGQRRDSSYEISNAVVFDPSWQDTPGVEGNAERAWDIERVVFSQPANATGCPLTFSVVTRKDGELAMTLNWQVGVLGLADENGFAQAILRRIDASLAEIAGDMTHHESIRDISTSVRANYP